MDISNMPYMLAIVALVYVLAEFIKASPLDNKWLPPLCGVMGIALGIVCLVVGVPDFPATDPVTAGAVGAVSGLAATGVNQIYKQQIK